jgi:hypothetical protein
LTELGDLLGKRADESMSHSRIEDQFAGAPPESHQQENEFERLYLTSGNDFGTPDARRSHLAETAGAMAGGAAGLGAGMAAMHAAARMGRGAAIAPLLPVGGMIGGMVAGHNLAKNASDEELPYDVDHPYMSAFGKDLAGGAIGGIGGAAIGAALGGLPGAAAGGYAGAALGGIAGQVKTLVDHDRGARSFEKATGADMPFPVRHPYLTDAAVQTVLPGIGRIGSSLLHSTEKTRMMDRLRREG